MIDLAISCGNGTHSGKQCSAYWKLLTVKLTLSKQFNLHCSSYIVQFVLHHLYSTDYTWHSTDYGLRSHCLQPNCLHRGNMSDSPKLILFLFVKRQLLYFHLFHFKILKKFFVTKKFNTFFFFFFFSILLHQYYHQPQYISTGTFMVAIKYHVDLALITDKNWKYTHPTLIKFYCFPPFWNILLYG